MEPLSWVPPVHLENASAFRPLGPSCGHLSRGLPAPQRKQRNGRGNVGKWTDGWMDGWVGGWAGGWVWVGVGGWVQLLSTLNISVR